MLDIGCGNGEFLNIAREMGWQTEGIDMDAKAVEVCRSRGLKVACGSVELLTHEKEKYDVITISHVIEHVHDPLNLLHQIHRLLKPGGLLWLETPNLGSLGYKRYKANWRGLEPPRHLVLFDLVSLTNILHIAGFKSVRQRWRGMVVFSMFAISEAIERDIAIENASRKGKPKLNEIAAEILEMILPAKREFLTFLARKE